MSQNINAESWIRRLILLNILPTNMFFLACRKLQGFGIEETSGHHSYVQKIVCSFFLKTCSSHRVHLPSLLWTGPGQLFSLASILYAKLLTVVSHLFQLHSCFLD